MVERAVEWLYTGGRAALRIPKKHSRSRRHLHSAFWSHGAGNINLPAWWLLFLQNSEAREPYSNPRHQSPKTALSTGLREIFLHFLYPVHTLALIQRLRQSTNAQRHAAQNISYCSRSYTSIAKSFLTGAKADDVGTGTKAEDASNTHAPLPGDALRRGIKEMLDLQDHTWIYNDLWQSYQDLLQLSQSLSPEDLIKMMRCLGKSSRTIDMERAVALFESISVEQRRAIHYRYAILAALSLKDLRTAIKIHREAVARINGSIGTAAILRYTVQHQKWRLAIDTWYVYWVNSLRYYTSPDIWDGVKSLPLTDLMHHATSAANFAMNTAQFPQAETAMAARDFALEMIKNAFRIQKTDFDLWAHERLLLKAGALDSNNQEIPTMALQQLLSIDNNDHGRRAIYLYRLLRQDPKFAPSKKLLSSITQKLVALKLESPLGLHMIIKDWGKHYQKVPAHVAINVAKVFAQRGDLDSVQALFRDFRSTYGVPSTAVWYHLLIFIHNRRADTEGVVRCFNKLQQKFQFKPTLSAWNYVIGTFSRIGDIDGALSWFNKLLESDLRPDSHIYFQLLSMFARRGDWVAVQDVYRQSKMNDIRTTMPMFNCIVVANINDGRLAEAEQLVKDALRLDLEGSRTFMWTVLLNAYAVRSEVEKVSQLHKEMRHAGVASDGMTYAALMTSLMSARMPKPARIILQEVLPRAKIRRTALHYAIAMEGYLRMNQFKPVFRLYYQMQTLGIGRTMTTQNIFIRAASKSVMQINPTMRVKLRRAENSLRRTISIRDRKELAASEPRPFVGPELLPEAFSSTYFDYIIYLYGNDAAYSKVTELYESYVSTSAQFRDVEASPPIRMLSALMTAHINAGNHDEVERCWDLALEKSKKLANRANADVSEPGWVLHSRRNIMNLPLRQHLKSLKLQNRVEDEISLVDQLGVSGFALNSATWNQYIEDLARSPERGHQLLAFELCERELMAHWPGWDVFGDPTWVKDKFGAMTKTTLKKHRRQTPHYPTLIFLASVYLQARQGTRLIDTGQLAAIAPKTVDAIVTMPRMVDPYQITYLRGG